MYEVCYNVESVKQQHQREAERKLIERVINIIIYLISKRMVCIRGHPVCVKGGQVHPRQNDMSRASVFQIKENIFWIL